MTPFEEEQAPLSSLTDAEREECQAYVNSFFAKTNEGQLHVHKDIADAVYRMLAANCLMWRAQSFLISAGFVHVGPVPQNSRTDRHMYGGDPHRRRYGECVANAIATAAKACAIYPLSINFYDSACLLQSIGKEQEAKTAFTEFLKRYRTFPIRTFEEQFFNERNMDLAVREAENTLSKSSANEKVRTEVTAETVATALGSFTFEPAPEDVLAVLGTDIDGNVADRGKVAHELFLLRICVIADLLLHVFRGDDTLVVFWLYRALCWRYPTELSLNEATVLDELEERQPVYCKAEGLWRQGLRIEQSGLKRPPESVLSLHEAFASFCGMKRFGIQFIMAFQNEHGAIYDLCSRLLGTSQIVCSAQEISSAKADL